MSDVLNKVEKEGSKLEKEKSNFNLDLQSEVQNARKTFKHKLSKDQRGIESAIRDVNKLYEERNQMYEEHNVTIRAEIETYTEKQQNIIDQQVKDRTFDLNNFKVAVIDQCNAQ